MQVQYNNEDKSAASKRLKNDPQVEFYNNQINYINDLWCYPRVIKIGSTIISDQVPVMPEEVTSKIESLKSERELYIKSNYPELF